MAEMISAEVAVYPLREPRLGPAIHAFQGALEESGVSIEPGPMATIVYGEAPAVFGALQAAFERAASGRQLVMTVTVSNACPYEPPGATLRQTRQGKEG